MNENVRAFFEAAQADPELRQRLCKMTMDELVAAAKEKGFELSEEDFKPAEGELGEGDLANAAGGGFCSCILGGGGGGTDSYDHNTYGCACVFYGQGGDGRGTDANCYCPVSGIGNDYSQYCIKTGWDAR